MEETTKTVSTTKLKANDRPDLPKGRQTSATLRSEPPVGREKPPGSDIFEREIHIFPALERRKGVASGLEKTKGGKRDSPAKKRLDAREQAVAAYTRAEEIFGKLPAFPRYNSLPAFFHFTPRQIRAYESITGSAAPSVWFIPEMIYLRDLTALGLKGGWWEREPNFPHLPTMSPYLGSEEDCDRGGTWVVWQPRLLPMSRPAGFEEQRRMPKRLAVETGLNEKDIRFGDITEQAVLWLMALKCGLVGRKAFLAARTDTVLWRPDLTGGQFELGDINLGLMVSPNGLEIADYGNAAALECLGVAPFLI